jgi:hypothetical protein
LEASKKIMSTLQGICKYPRKNQVKNFCKRRGGVCVPNLPQFEVPVTRPVGQVEDVENHGKFKR